MIKLKEHLLSSKTGRRDFNGFVNSLLSVEREGDKISRPTVDFVDEYKILFSCGCNFKTTPECFSLALEDAKNRMMRYLLGDVAERLYQARMAVYAGDRNETLKILSGIIEDMQ